MKQEPKAKVTSVLYWLMLVGLVILCVSVVYPEYQETKKVQVQLEQLQRKKAEGEEKINSLKREISNMDKPEYVEKAAREELGLVRPDEVKYIFE